MKTKLKDGTKVIIANARLSYAHIFEPVAFEGQEPKYSVSLIISKDDTETVELIKEAIKNALEDGKEKFWSGKTPKNLKNPLRDGDVDREEDEAYQNSYFINVSRKDAPQVVSMKRDLEGKPIPLGPSEVYSGCYANVSVNFFPYNNVSKGISGGLLNIQKCADGEPLGGAASTAEDDFDFTEDDGDDFLS